MKLTKDIVIPAGTVFNTAPTKTERYGEGHIQADIALGADHTLTVGVCLDDGGLEDMFEDDRDRNHNALMAAPPCFCGEQVPTGDIVGVPEDGPDCPQKFDPELGPNFGIVDRNLVAKVLYTTYCEAVGGVAFNGDPLPNWEEFAADPDKTKQSGAWLATADAAMGVVKYEISPKILYVVHKPHNAFKGGVYEPRYTDSDVQIAVFAHFSGDNMIAIAAEDLDNLIHVADLHGWEVTIAE